MDKQNKGGSMSKDDERVLIDKKNNRLQRAKPKATGQLGLPAIAPNSNGQKQSKQGNMSKEDEWVLIDEKIYRLQGAKPKAIRQQGLPAVRPNSNGEKQRDFTSPGNQHFQEDESRSKFKCSRKRPQELISVGNVSLVTARQGNKIPYCRSAPLPRWSPSRISPSRLSPSPRTPYSAPPQMTSAFQWPPVQGQKEQRNFKDNYDVSEAGETESSTSTKVYFPQIQTQQHRLAESMKSQCNPTYKELAAKHEGEVKRRPSLSEDDQCQTASTFTRRSGTRNSSTGQKKSEEILKVKNMEQNFSYTANCTCELQNAINSDRGTKQVSFAEPGARQGTEEDMPSLKQENGSKMKKATIKSKKENLLCKRKINETAQVGSERRQKYIAPHRIGRERFLKTENDEPEALNEQSESSLEQDDFEEVFEFPPVPASQRQQAVSDSPQKAMSVDAAGVAAVQEKKQSKDLIDLCNTASKLNVLNGIGPRSFSPDSFVAQLIANTEKLILNDSTESPTLQQRKKLARKKFC